MTHCGGVGDLRDCKFAKFSWDVLPLWGTGLLKVEFESCGIMFERGGDKSLTYFLFLSQLV